MRAGAIAPALVLCAPGMALEKDYFSETVAVKSPSEALPMS
jgi:hypothetical protein